jgi:hypothetical protein
MWVSVLFVACLGPAWQAHVEILGSLLLVAALDTWAFPVLLAMVLGEDVLGTLELLQTVSDEDALEGIDAAANVGGHLVIAG